MLLSGLLIGYYHRDLLEVVKRLKTLQATPKPEEIKEEPRSMIVEALTPEQEAKKALEERVKRLNQ